MSTKRSLTSLEIEEMIDFVIPNPALPKDTAASLVKKNKDRFRNQLKSIQVYPEVIPALKKEIYNQYLATQVQAGESVGILTAQSIGERQTQSTLNTFHSTGLAIKTVLTGVPRFSELLHATREPKAINCQIFMKKRHETIDSIRKEIGNSMAHFKLKKLCKTAKIFTLPEEAEEEWYDVFEILVGKEHRKYTQGIIFNLDKNLMFEFGISTEMVAKKIQDNFMDAAVVWSPNNLARVDVWIDVAEADYDEEIFSSPDEAINTYLEEVCKPALSDLSICGIEGVSAVFYDRKEGEWMVETDGSNLRKLFAHPAVDATRTTSNDMWEIYENLGIEAARNFLIEEFTGVISSDGTFVNDSHALLLVDVMTFSGTITSVSRYGLKKEACGPMAKASFEESLDNFLKAGQNGDRETTYGVSASIMLGKMGKFGTGLCDVVIDVKQLAGLPRTINQQVKEKR